MKCMFFNYLIVSFLHSPIETRKNHRKPLYNQGKVRIFARFLIIAPRKGASLFYNIDNE